jgi:cell division protein FtsB
VKALKTIENLARKTAGRKNRAASILVLIAVPVFVLLAGFRILGSREATANVAEQNAGLRQQYQQYQAQNQEYQAVLNNDDPDIFRDFVIRTARERLGLSLPGDHVFIDRVLF